MEKFVDNKYLEKIDYLNRLTDGVCVVCGKGTTPELGIFCSLRCKHSIDNSFLEDIVNIHNLGDKLSSIDYYKKYSESDDSEKESLKRRKIDYKKLLEIRKILSPIEIENGIREDSDFDIFED